MRSSGGRMAVGVERVVVGEWVERGGGLDYKVRYIKVLTIQFTLVLS